MTDKTVEGDLVLEADLKIDGNLTVRGNIYGKDGIRYNINALNIDAWDINARDIDAWNINAWNINAWDINAGDINAGDINAGDIICISREKKSKDAKTMACGIVLDKFNRERREVMPELQPTKSTRRHVIIHIGCT